MRGLTCDITKNRTACAISPTRMAFFGPPKTRIKLPVNGKIIVSAMLAVTITIVISVYPLRNVSYQARNKNFSTTPFSFMWKRKMKYCHP